MDLMVIVIRLSVAIVCGAIIGFEREIRDKAAGLRTHILVCIGACLFGMLGMVLSEECGKGDILRIAQGLIMGIGFLGAGVIFKEGASIKGLTTAAGVWVMGAIGISIGVGQYRLALLGTLFSFIVMTLFGRAEGLIKK